MVKGAGMIRPNLATMLSFLVTDAYLKAPLLQRMLEEAAEVSYNCITVDGETSTNDTVLLLANGKADHPSLNRMDRDGKKFQSMLSEVCQNLAKSLVKDGEGATKFIEIPKLIPIESMSSLIRFLWQKTEWEQGLDWKSKPVRFSRRNPSK
jgi:glutamate N-acetyltransferase/amino-acid N-acetyltransferase